MERLSWIICLDPKQSRVLETGESRLEGYQWGGEGRMGEKV